MTGKNILICPLDWGLGHAARCIPIIRKLCSLGHNVIIAASGRPFEFLKKEFPELEHIRFNGSRISYGKNIPLPLQIFLLLPFIFTGIATEHRRLRKIVHQRQIDIVISDNRFGLWNRRVKTVFITHQLFIKAGKGLSIFNGILRKINHGYIRRYDVCWVPDLPVGDTLSGDLSHGEPMPQNVKYIGPLNRFESVSGSSTGKMIPVCIIISGPEPQRSIFEKIAIESLSNSESEGSVICGKSEENSDPVQVNNVTIYPFLTGKEMHDVLMRSQLIIARSGYTSIMDIAGLGKKAVFVPTPGQAEQEYLAENLMQRKLFFSMQQREFDLEIALKRSAEYTGVNISSDGHLLDQALANILDQ